MREKNKVFERRKRIMLAGGGTLGPVTPLLAIVEASRIEKLPYSFYWVGTRGGPELRLVREADIPFFWISVGKLRRYWSLKNFVLPLFFFIALCQSFWLILRLKPDVIVNAGGFTGVPLSYIAYLARIPVILHEQDVKDGLAIKLMRPVASLRTSIWEKIGAQAIGNMVRPSLYQGDVNKLTRPLPKGVPLILVTGGGTGAQSINYLVVEALPKLLSRAGVVHVTGLDKGVNVPQSPKYLQAPFVTSAMRDLYAAASLVICRGGMGTLTELAALSKAAIVLPLSGQQELNAERVKAEGAAVVLSENQTSANELALVALQLIDDKKRRIALGEALHRLIPDGTQPFLNYLSSLL